MIAIDQSNSSLFASGVDVDGDTQVGRNRTWLRRGEGYGEPHRIWTTDAGDTILAAELAAASALVEALADRGSRIGILTFSHAVRVRAPLGSSADARSALATIHPSPAYIGTNPTRDRDIRRRADRTGTDLVRAITIAADLFGPAPSSEEMQRLRSILLFTDGRPTLPNGRHWASKHALEKARELAERDVAILGVAIGDESDPVFLAELASASGGGLLTLADLQGLASRRLPLRFDELDLAIENLTVQRSATEVRMHPDGSFDGIVPLAPGENLLEIRVLHGDERLWSEQRAVPHPTADGAVPVDSEVEARQLLELRDRLREPAPP